MPWNTSDVKKFNSGLTTEEEAAWVKVANAWLKDHPEDDASAIKIANAAMKKLKDNSLENTLTSLRHNMSALVQKRQLDGVDYLVAPSVLLVEGVLNNVYYPAEEIAKSPDTWNGRPVVINHSTSPMGTPITANSPEERAKRTVGMIYNARYENRRLKAEVWIDPIKCAKVADGAEILRKLNAEEPIEVSTGVNTKDLVVSGVFGNKGYGYIAFHHVGDHLALLPFETGACAWGDGAGLPRVNAQQEGAMNMTPEETAASTERQGRWSKFIAGMHDLFSLRSNKRSFGNTQSELTGLVRKAHSKTMPNGSCDVWVVEVFDTSVIFETFLEGGYLLWEQDYKTNEDGSLELTGETRRVRAETDYVPLKSNQETGTTEGETEMEKEKLVNELIKANVFVEGARAGLMALDDAALGKIHVNMIKVETPATIPVIPVAAAPEALAPASPKANTQAGTVKTADEFIAAAPPEIREVLQAGMTLHKTRRAALTAKLKANTANKFSDAELDAMPVDTLDRIVRFAAPSFAGNGGADPAGVVLHDNANEIEPPVLPTSRFAPKKD